jgi:Tol biopolymer transport system component
MKKRPALTILSFLFFAFASAQMEARWMQQPAISPDGKWIAFEYKGNLFKVPAEGGSAVALTINSSYNGYPVWSHDGK